MLELVLLLPEVILPDGVEEAWDVVAAGLDIDLEAEQAQGFGCHRADAGGLHVRRPRESHGGEILDR